MTLPLFPALAAQARPAAPTPRPGPVVPPLRDADARDRGPFARDTWQHAGAWVSGETDVPPVLAPWRPWSAPCGCAGVGYRAAGGRVLGRRQRRCSDHVRGPAFDWLTATMESP